MVIVSQDINNISTISWPGHVTWRRQHSTSSWWMIWRHLGVFWLLSIISNLWRQGNGMEFLRRHGEIMWRYFGSMFQCSVPVAYEPLQYRVLREWIAFAKSRATWELHNVFTRFPLSLEANSVIVCRKAFNFLYKNYKWILKFLLKLWKSFYTLTADFKLCIYIFFKIEHPTMHFSLWKNYFLNLMNFLLWLRPTSGNSK